MKCPKCGAEIPRFDLSPNCKKCGAHLLYYTQEKDLENDAKKTELEFSAARILVAKIKAVFIGSKIAVLRTVVALLGVVALVLPLFEIRLSFPWWEYKISVGALGVYGFISDSFLPVFMKFSSLGTGDSLFYVTAAALVLFIVSVLITLVILVMLILSFVSPKKTSGVITAFSAAGAVTALAETVLSFVAMGLGTAFADVSVTVFYGSLLSLAVFLATAFVNAAFRKNVPQAVISEADEKRTEIKRMLKKGEITIDELPLPIIEEEKKEDAPLDKKKKRGKK